VKPSLLLLPDPASKKRDQQLNQSTPKITLDEREPGYPLVDRTHEEQRGRQEIEVHCEQKRRRAVVSERSSWP
jgi:hypothetical protein